MGQSLAAIKVHLVFNTKNRVKIINPKDDSKLYAYMAEILKDISCPPKIINGMPEHIHILFELNKNLALCKAVEKVKSTSSKWIKKQGIEYATFQWQGGYAGFSVSRWDVKKIMRYIDNQKKHHNTQTYEDELIDHLKKENIDFDEKYLWD